MLAEIIEAETGQEALRRIERELRWLHVRIGSAIVVAPTPAAERVAFGATVRVVDEAGKESTYVIVGEDDICTPPRFSEELARVLPHADLVRVADAGHCAVFEQPDAVARVIRGFLSAQG